MIRVAIIEDHPSTRLGLASIVRAQPDMELLVAAQSVEDFEAARPEDVHAVMLDLYLESGGVEGASAVARLVKKGHTVLVVSMSDEEVSVHDAIGAGAHGYLTKEAEPDEIVRALRAVANRRTYFSATVAGFLLREQIPLTTRQVEILRLVAGGEKTAQIAEQLHISETTVNRHLERIRDRTGYRRRADLTRLAYERGIISRFRRPR